MKEYAPNAVSVEQNLYMNCSMVSDLACVALTLKTAEVDVICYKGVERP